jgi:arginase
MAGGRKSVRLVVVPYDAGQRGVRMGAGPQALATAAAPRLSEAGYAVEEQVVEPLSAWRSELRTAFELHRGIAAAVTGALREGQVPLVLSGNCNATLGVLAGLAGSGDRLGLVWLDAHGDFNTPDTDPGGFLDGQGLAMVAGRCWRALTSSVPGFVPLPEDHILLVGARSFDDAEYRALRQSRIGWVPAADVRRAAPLAAALGRLARQVDLVHFHLDLDVHDPSIAPANEYAAPDGLSAEEVQRTLRQTAERIPVASACLAAYDPAFDPSATLRGAALAMINLFAAVATPT